MGCGAWGSADMAPFLSTRQQVSPKRSVLPHPPKLWPSFFITMGIPNGFMRISAPKRRWTQTRITRIFTPNIRIPRLDKTVGLAGVMLAGRCLRSCCKKSVPHVAQVKLERPKLGPWRHFDLRTRSNNWRKGGLTPDVASVKQIQLFLRMKRKGMSPIPRAWVMMVPPKRVVLVQRTVSLKTNIRTSPLVFGHCSCLGFGLSNRSVCFGKSL